MGNFASNDGSAIEHVYLNMLNGYEFEKLCARIFRRHEYKVTETPYSNDEGRDLIMNKNGEKILVECKHHQASIGRPVIQKLDSAVRMDNADKGIVITTSTFSPEAIKYAEKLNPPIMLLDKYSLIDLAHQVGIEISEKIGTLNVFCYPVSDSVQIKKKLQKIYDRFQSSPYKASEIMKITSNELELQSKYLITYDIHANFSTSTGREIHSIHKDNNVVMLDAEDSSELASKTVDFLQNSTLTDENMIPKQDYLISRHYFKIHHTSLMSTVGNIIIEKYSTNMKYRGDNNVQYSKFWVPRVKDIHITDIKQVLVPLHRISIKSINQNYLCTFFENNLSLQIVHTDLFKCKICSKEIKKQMLLCNDCGKISHRPSFFMSHSFICKQCNKTIYKDCNNSVKRYLFFKKSMCRACAHGDIPKQNNQILPTSKISENLSSTSIEEQTRYTPTKENSLSDKFVSKLIQNSKNNINTNIYKNKKTALILSIFCGLIGFQGLCHIYTNQVIKGVIFLSIGLILVFMWLAVIYASIIEFDKSSEDMTIRFMIFEIPYFVLYFYQIIDIRKSFNF